LTRVKQRNGGRSVNRSSRADPGPSKPAPASKSGRTHITKNNIDDSDIEELPAVVDSLHDTDEEPKQRRRGSAKRSSGRDESNASNGKGKKSTKEERKSKLAQNNPPTSYAIDNDPIEVMDEDEQAGPGPTVAAAITSATKSEIALRRGDTSSFGEQLRLVRYSFSYQIFSMGLQLMHTWLVAGRSSDSSSNKRIEGCISDQRDRGRKIAKNPRSTIPSAAARFASTSAAYFFQVLLMNRSAQELLIKELTSQLSRKERLTRTGKTSVLNLITREAADEEQRNIEKEVTLWKRLAEEKELSIGLRDERITELEQKGSWSLKFPILWLNFAIERQLAYELNLEIERSKELAIKVSRKAPAAARDRPGGADDPKHAEVIRFYEDLTNLLVCSMKLQKANRFNLDEWVLSCIYSYEANSDPNVKKSVYIILFVRRTIIVTTICFRSELYAPFLSRVPWWFRSGFGGPTYPCCALCAPWAWQGTTRLRREAGISGLSIYVRTWAALHIFTNNRGGRQRSNTGWTK
jgi:hypothetical protein